MTAPDITLPHLALSVLLVVVAVLVSRRASLGLERDLAWGAVRAAVQLVAIGYVLRSLFAHESAPLVALALALMLAVAAWTAARRVVRGPGARVLLPHALGAIAGGALVALVPVALLVVQPSPWFEARYAVPVGGMMLANAMNVVALVFERAFASAHAERDLIEQCIALGASPVQALASQSRAALRAALLPSINGLLTVGLVALPGMMTGQILGGAPPEHAVRYQLVVMYQLVAVAAVSGALAVRSARTLLFTARGELRGFER